MATLAATPRLDGKVAFVTGSTRGIGEGIARVFAAEGAHVVVSGRNASDGARGVADIAAAGGQATYVHLDLADEADVAVAFETAIETCGRLDVLVNNAAPTELLGFGGVDGRVHQLTTEGWRAIMAPGLDGLFWACRAALPHLVASGRGAIVNISSAVARFGVAGMDAYTASKGAMSALTRSLAVEYAPDNVRCNCIVVSGIESPGHVGLADESWREASRRARPLGRFGTPEDIGHAAAYLASDQAGFVTGASLDVDGGMMCRLQLPPTDSPC